MPGAKDASLLPKISGKILIFKDWTSLLSINKDARAEIMGQFREVYDGEMKKPFGNGKIAQWKGKIGFVPTVLKETAPSPDNAVALVCGPPIMIKFSLQALGELGFSDEQVYTTLENKMKCGLGKCGRCNVGDIYICKEGPVYTAAEVKRMYPDL